MAQTFGCPPHVLATATATDGALDLIVFGIGMEIEAAIQKATEAGGSSKQVFRLMEREAEAEAKRDGVR